MVDEMKAHFERMIRDQNETVRLMVSEQVKAQICEASD
jgi:hypothetical protein